MNQRISTSLAVGLCALLLFAEVGLAQEKEKNPTTYPYGGAPDKSRMAAWMNKPPLNFKRRADFSWAAFDKEADFGGATFDSIAPVPGT